MYNVTTARPALAAFDSGGTLKSCVNSGEGNEMPKVAVLEASELAEGAVREVAIEGYPRIAVYHLDDGFFATDDLCTHGNASLAEGDIEGGEIICPFHEGSFNIRTGEATGPPCLVPIRTYPVEVVDGTIHLTLPD